MTKRIALTRGCYALVDDADYERVACYRWAATGGEYVYAARKVAADGKQRTILMHRFILGLEDAPRSVYVDHRNGDTLDNRRANLRQCDNKGNQGNRKMQGGTSRYRGVSWDARRGKWRARIRVNRTQVSLGQFVPERDAADAYNVAAVAHFGEFAKLNVLE